MELPIFIHSRVENPDDYIAFCCEDMSSCGYVFVCETTCTFNPPPRVEQISKHIAVLRAEQANIRAEAESKANRLEETIQKLLCIEYKPDEDGLPTSSIVFNNLSYNGPEVDPDKYGFL